MLDHLGRRNILIGLPLALASLGSVSGVFAQDLTPYGMIEVGSSGVKISAYQLVPGVVPNDGDPTAPGFQRYGTTRLGGFDENPLPLLPENVDATARAVVSGVSRLRTQFNVAPERVFIVGSSGIAGVPHRAVLQQQIEQMTSKEMTFITPYEEAKLGFKWIVLGPRRSQVVLIDIGSGNTKGGYLERVGTADENFRDFAIPFGTKKLTDLAKERFPDLPFKDAVAAVRASDIDPALESISATAPGVVTRPRAYMIGGIVWAIATLIRPDSVVPVRPGVDGGRGASPDWVPLSRSDFTALRNKLDLNQQFNVTPSRLMSGENRTWLEQEVARVSETFTPDQLRSGLEICSALSSKFEFANKAAIFFATFSRDAWSSQYLVEQVSGQGAG